MTLSSAGFVGEVNDVEWALLNQLGPDGTVGFSVSAAGGDRTVSIGSGQSNVGGVLAVEDSSDTLQLPSNPSSSTRIDRVVLRATWGDSFLRYGFRQGTPSSNPQPATLTRDPGKEYEVSLAQVRLSPGHGALSSGDITREATPSASGFYAITSIATAPDPGDHALIFYTAQDSLRVGDGGSYKELASLRTAPAGIPSGPANWNGTNRYMVKSGVVEIDVDLRRVSSASPDQVELGRMPSGLRPPATVFRSLFSAQKARSYRVEITTGGVITAYGLDLVGGDRLQGGFTYIVA